MNDDAARDCLGDVVGQKAAHVAQGASVEVTSLRDVFSRVAVESRVVVDGHVRQLSDLSCGPTSRVLPSSGDVDTQQW